MANRKNGRAGARKGPTMEQKRLREEAERAARVAEQERIQAEADAEVDRQIREAQDNAMTEGDYKAEERAVAERIGPAMRPEDTLAGSEEDDDEDVPDTLFVQDLTSRDQKTARVHTLIFDGTPKDFPFMPGEKVELPFAHAAKFLIDDAFVVTDHDGHVYTPSPKRIKTSDVKALRPDQVIAELAELTDDALYIRAVKFPGGEVLNRATSRSDLIEFLVEAHAQIDEGERRADGRLFGSQMDRVPMEDMDDASVARLLAG